MNHDVEAQDQSGRKMAGKEATDCSGSSLSYMDGILRNRDRSFQAIFNDAGTLRQILRLAVIITVLSAFHGLAMGMSSGYLQAISSSLKVPVLFLATLAVCFPTLYVVNVIMGSNLGFQQTLALILLAMALTTILLAACSPIVLFFTITGSTYPFIKLLNVVIFAFSGAVTGIARHVPPLGFVPAARHHYSAGLDPDLWVRRHPDGVEFAPLHRHTGSRFSNIP